MANYIHMGFDHQPRKKMVGFEIPPIANACDQDWVLTITWMHSCLIPNKHTITNKHEQKIQS